MSSEHQTVITPAAQEKSVETSVELGKRAFALRKFEEATEHYGQALELATEKYGDGAPETADLLFLYGKALLENAISQAGVVGKEEAEDAMKGVKEAEAGPSSAKASGKAPVIEFSGDAEEDEYEDEAVDLFAAANDAADAEEKEEDAPEEEGEEPEDDFNAAWEVLDLARALYARQDGDEAKLKLADTYIALGDVSLETEKFDQAATDYTAGLHLKSQLLPFHSRQIAEAHYRLSMVLDLTPGKLAAAVEQAERALASVTARLDALKAAMATAPSRSEDDPKSEDALVDIKGKGKPSGMLGNLANDTIEGLKKEQIESQIKEFEELRNDLTTKVEDLKVAPEQAEASAEGSTSAPIAAMNALDAELNAGPHITSGPVNDLSSVVKKKKKPTTNGTIAETNGALSGSKRKAEDDAMDTATTPTEKKIKLVDETARAADVAMQVE